ncbi:TetR family transcriptional regulator [Stenotrophomonas sp. HITSZ_GD]|uniref:TetR family transcriptional regulator n=1 Tax=Stenotrophomonas sp. HITSZ_GD TaxID=3037248 RepID=UPI00240CF9D7|nr:TetR family transcriptional regulator [Stenotrophomonas sp. HITSZ_GD]MDG2524197.1 TetR family transcriptional regulator [Stenotrophomonas sp. HITSZ_GD]
MSRTAHAAGVDAAAEGLRERKRRETHQRITDAGLKLFLSRGFAATTLDDIASEAGISRRTFFSYFKSKDDIILSMQNAGWAAMYADILKASPDTAPLDAVRDVMIKHMSRYTTEEMTALDALMRSSDTLASRKQAFYAEQEQALFDTLCEVWRQPERRTALRMVAIVSIGAIKLTTQTWNAQAGPKRPMVKLLREAFESLRSEV